MIKLSSSRRTGRLSGDLWDTVASMASRRRACWNVCTLHLGCTPTSSRPSFKLKDKRREGARVVKRYHVPATPYARALAHPKLSAAVKQRLRELYRTLDPVALLAEMRDAQTELGARVDCRAGKIAAAPCIPPPAPDAAAFAKGLGKAVLAGEQRAIHRRRHKPYKKRVRMPAMLDPHVEAIERWLAV